MKFKRIKYTISLLLLIAYFSISIYSKVEDTPSVVEQRMAQVFGKFQTDKNKYNGDKQKYIWILDAGHGFRTFNCGYKSAKDLTDAADSCFYEYEFNISVRNYLASMLDSADIGYTLMGVEYYDIPLKQRVKAVESHMKYYSHTGKKTALMSIHANATKYNNTQVEGFEVYAPSKSYYKGKYLQENRKSMSDSIASILAQMLKINFSNYSLRKSHPNRYNREAGFTILSKVPCFSVLSENNFFTNPAIRAKMQTPEFQYKVALAHFRTILLFEEKLVITKD